MLGPHVECVSHHSTGVADAMVTGGEDCIYCNVTLVKRCVCVCGEEGGGVIRCVCVWRGGWRSDQTVVQHYIDITWVHGTFDSRPILDLTKTVPDFDRACL